MNYVFVLALGIGIVAGLRSLTAPAVVAWAAHLGWLNLHGTSLAFMIVPPPLADGELTMAFELMTKFRRCHVIL